MAVQQSAVYPFSVAMRRRHRLSRQLGRTELHGRRRRQARQVDRAVGRSRAAADTVRRQPVPLCDVARVYQRGVVLRRRG